MTHKITAGETSHGPAAIIDLTSSELSQVLVKWFADSYQGVIPDGPASARLIHFGDGSINLCIVSKDGAPLTGEEFTEVRAELK